MGNSVSHEKRDDCADVHAETFKRLRDLEREVEGMIREWKFARAIIMITFPIFIAAGWGVASKWWEVSATLARIEARLEAQK